MNTAEATTQTMSKPPKPSVLFVDDEKRVLNSMRAMFRRDYNLFLTTRGDEALQMIKDNEIDVVVADQRMPIMTGVEVLSAVKRQSPDTVRILLTGYADLEAIEGAMNEGEVFRFLSKPCAAEELRGTIRLATEIASETSGVGGSNSTDLDDDSFLDHMAAADASDIAIDDAIDFGSTMVLSDAPVVTAPESPATSDVSASVTTASANDEEGAPSAAQPPRPVAEPSEPISNAATMVLDDEPLAPTLAPAESLEQDSVEIVMSGDSHTEVNPNAPAEVDHTSTAVLDVAPTLTPPRQASPDKSPVKLMGTGKYKVSVMVFTSDEQFAKSIGRSLQDYFYTFQATNVAHLMHGISKVGPAVLITDISEDPEVLEQLASQLKQRVPEMVTMVASPHRDAELMVRLINHGQVFRFVDKPLSSTACKRHVREAIKKHIQLRDNPELISRHQVVKTDNSKLPSSIGRLITGIGRVRKFWGRKAH